MDKDVTLDVTIRADAEGSHTFCAIDVRWLLRSIIHSNNSIFPIHNKASTEVYAIHFDTTLTGETLSLT